MTDTTPNSSEELAAPAVESSGDRYERMRARFFTASEHADVVALRTAIVVLAETIDKRVPDGRNKSLALTALEDVQMRANRGLFAPKEYR